MGDDRVDRVGEELALRVHKALEAHGQTPVPCVFSVSTLCYLVGLLQVACRHPDLPPDHVAYTITSAIGNTLAEIDPAFSDLVKAGWQS